MGVQEGRYRAEFPEGTVVFMIGMRVNRPWRVRAWLQVFMAMPKMMRELFQQPELGLLDARSEIGWRRITVIQYWESMDRLMTYAASRDHAHLPAWREYNRLAREAGAAVGIWHEAYAVDPARAHVMHRNMPSFGIGKATAAVPADQAAQPVPGRRDGDDPGLATT